MSKLQILLIEDQEIEANIMKKALKEFDCEIVGIASTLKEAFGYYYSEEIDLVIIDIFLHGQPDGIEFAKTITKNRDTLKPFIYVTSATDRFVFDTAKETKPNSYLFKPFNPLELEYAIELAIENFAGTKGELSEQEEASVMVHNSFFIKKRKSLFKVKFNDIHYIEVEGKYCNVISDQGVFLIQLSLKELIERLKGHRFIRTHRNYIVNFDHIKELFLDDNLLILETGEQVLISRRYKENFVNTYEILK